LSLKNKGDALPCYERCVFGKQHQKSFLKESGSKTFDVLALLPKWGAIYQLKSLWDLKSEITSLHFTDFTVVKVISL
jgi:hypothetical protein